jgi:hypothetical protein
MTVHIESTPAAGESILSLLNNIIAITEEMVTTMEDGSHEEMEHLAALRQQCVDRLRADHAPSGTPPMDGTEMRKVIEQLNDITGRLTEQMEERSSSLISTINALQHKRHYGNEQRGRE